MCLGKKEALFFNCLRSQSTCFWQKQDNKISQVCDEAEPPSTLDLMIEKTNKKKMETMRKRKFYCFPCSQWFFFLFLYFWFFASCFSNMLSFFRNLCIFGVWHNGASNILYLRFRPTWDRRYQALLIIFLFRSSHLSYTLCDTHLNPYLPCV